MDPRRVTRRSTRTEIGEAFAAAAEILIARGVAIVAEGRGAARRESGTVEGVTAGHEVVEQALLFGVETVDAGRRTVSGMGRQGAALRLSLAKTGADGAVIEPRLGVRIEAGAEALVEERDGVDWARIEVVHGALEGARLILDEGQ
jgi:hypothetical protein